MKEAPFIFTFIFIFVDADGGDEAGPAPAGQTARELAAVLLKKFCFSIVFFCSFPFSFGEEAQPDARE